MADTGRPGCTRGYLPTRHGDVQTMALGLDHDAIPFLYLHDLPGGFALHVQDLDRLANTRPVISFDLGGNSESLLTCMPDLQLWMDQIEDVASALKMSRFTIYAHGTSAALALQFALAHPEQVNRIILRSPPFLQPHERAALNNQDAPDITPTDDAGHMLKLWLHLRDQELWYPWFRRDHSSRRTTPPRIDPVDLTHRAVTLLKQPRNYAPIWHEILAHDVASLLSVTSVPIDLTHDPADLFAFSVQRMAGSNEKFTLTGDDV